MTYDYDKAAEIIGDDSLTENEVMSLVNRAERRALNYYFWSEDNWGKSGSQSIDEILGFLIGRKTYVV